MNSKIPVWSIAPFIGGVGLCVLGFYNSSGAAPQGGQLPFANSVEQRNETNRELREIKELLKEQNALLKASATAKSDAPEKPKR